MPTRAATPNPAASMTAFPPTRPSYHREPHRRVDERRHGRQRPPPTTNLPQLPEPWYDREGPYREAAEPVSRPRTAWTAADLMATEFPPPRWAVPGGDRASWVAGLCSICATASRHPRRHRSPAALLISSSGADTDRHLRPAPPDPASICVPFQVGNTRSFGCQRAPAARKLTARHQEADTHCCARPSATRIRLPPASSTYCDRRTAAVSHLRSRGGGHGGTLLRSGAACPQPAFGGCQRVTVLYSR